MNWIWCGLMNFVDMRLFLVFLSVMLQSAVCLQAQDLELNKLTDIVKKLQHGGEPAYKAAISELSTDKLWTPMDELGFDRAVECRVSERVPGFKLNSVLTNAENAQRYQTTTGNHLNGADSRFNYSLFEKTIRAGRTATYSLQGRWGYQVFLIMPYLGERSGIKAVVTSGNNELNVSQLGNGCLKLEGVVHKDVPVSVKVVNESAENESYVIINYNSRK